MSSPNPPPALPVQAFRKVRAVLSRRVRDRPASDAFIPVFLRAFREAFPPWASMRVVVVADGGRCRLFAGVEREEKKPPGSPINPRYPGFPHHLKRIQQIPVFASNAYRVVPELSEFSGDNPLKATFGLPTILPAGKRLWLLLTVPLDRPPSAPDLDRLERLGRTLASHLVELEQADWLRREALMKAQEEAVGILAHELKAPLASLSHGLELIHSRPARRADWLDACRDRIAKTGRLIDAYLEYLRMGSCALGPVRLEPLLAEVRDFFRHRFDVLDIAWTAASDTPDVPMLNAHRVLAFQVFRNLVDNACKAIEAKQAPSRKNDAVLITVRAHWNWVKVSVSDTGIPMPVGMADCLFTLFATKFPEGHGLGLCICKKIMEAHGGSIEFESSPTGKGAFILTFLTAEGIKNASRPREICKFQD